MKIFKEGIGLVGQGVKSAWSFFEKVYVPTHLFNATESLNRSRGDGPKDSKTAPALEAAKQGMGFTLINRKNEQLYSTAIVTLLDPDSLLVMNKFYDWLKEKNIDKLRTIKNHIAYEYNDDKENLQVKLNMACDIGSTHRNEEMLKFFEQMSFVTSDLSEAAAITKQKMTMIFKSQFFKDLDQKFKGASMANGSPTDIKERMEKRRINRPKRPFYRFW